MVHVLVVLLDFPIAIVTLLETVAQEETFEITSRSRERVSEADLVSWVERSMGMVVTVA